MDDCQYEDWIKILNLRLANDMEIVPVMEFFPITVGFGIFHAKTSMLTIFLFRKKWYRPNKEQVALDCLVENLKFNSSKKIQTTQHRHYFMTLHCIAFLFAAMVAEIATREENWNNKFVPVGEIKKLSNANLFSFKDQVMPILKLQSCEITSESKKQSTFVSFLKNINSKKESVQNTCIKKEKKLPIALNSKVESEKSKPSQTENIAPGGSTENKPEPAESRTEKIETITLDSKSPDRNFNLSDLSESQFEVWINILNYRIFSRDIEIVPFIHNCEDGLACGFGIFNAKISKLTLYIFGKEGLDEVNEKLNSLIKILKSRVLQDIKTTVNDNFPVILHEFPFLLAAMIAEFATLRENWNHKLLQLKPPGKIANAHVSSFKNQILSILKFNEKIEHSTFNIRQIYYAMKKKFRFLSYDKKITFEKDTDENEDEIILVRTLTKMYCVKTTLERR